MQVYGAGMVSAKSPDDDASDRFAGLTDGQVLEVASDALRALERLKKRKANPNGPAWVLQVGLFDSAMGELSRRAMVQVLWKIHESKKFY